MVGFNTVSAGLPFPYWGWALTFTHWFITWPLPVIAMQLLTVAYINSIQKLLYDLANLVFTLHFKLFDFHAHCTAISQFCEDRARVRQQTILQLCA